MNSPITHRTLSGSLRAYIAAMAALLALPGLLAAKAPAQSETPSGKTAVAPQSGPQAAEAGARATEGSQRAVLGLLVVPCLEQPGLRVLKVFPGGPADEAGILPTDVIETVNDKQVVNVGQLMALLWREKPRNQVKLTFDHYGKQQTATTTLASAAALFGTRRFEQPVVRRAWLGVAFGPAQQQNGALVTHVYPKSPAARAGVLQGDTIVKANDYPIAGPDDLIQAIGSMRPGKNVSLTVLRGTQRLKLDVVLGLAEPFPPAPSCKAHLPK